MRRRAAKSKSRRLFVGFFKLLKVANHLATFFEITKASFLYPKSEGWMPSSE